MFRRGDRPARPIGFPRRLRPIAPTAAVRLAAPPLSARGLATLGLPFDRGPARAPTYVWTQCFGRGDRPARPIGFPRRLRPIAPTAAVRRAAPALSARGLATLGLPIDRGPARAPTYVWTRCFVGRGDRPARPIGFPRRFRPIAPTAAVRRAAPALSARGLATSGLPLDRGSARAPTYVWARCFVGANRAGAPAALGPRDRAP